MELTVEQTIILDYLIKKNNFICAQWKHWPTPPRIDISDELQMLKSIRNILNIGTIELSIREYGVPAYARWKPGRFPTEYELMVHVEDDVIWLCNALLQRFKEVPDFNNAEQAAIFTKEAMEAYIESREHGTRYELPYERRKRMGV